MYKRAETTPYLKAALGRGGRTKPEAGDQTGVVAAAQMASSTRPTAAGSEKQMGSEIFWNSTDGALGITGCVE